MNKQSDKLQFFKFGMYGFLKNLKFYEPYLLYYLTILSGLSLFQVGLLYSIREIVIYIFEIPSGVIADHYGKKLELVICFIFYILSFIMFFISTTFGMFVIAMILFGFGEAFRSGTHKAMIMQYLDIKEIKSSKSQVYGKTRSMSLLGSMTMSLISIVFILILPEIRYLFLIAIIPYLLDLLMILTYPKYLNSKTAHKFELVDFLKENYKSIKYALLNKPVRKLLIESSTYQAMFKSLKDYIQPIIIALSMGVIIFSKYSLEDNLKIYIGLIYAIIYLGSSFASRNAHYLLNKNSNIKITNLMWIITGTVMILLSFFLNQIIIIFIAFFVLYILQSARRPIMVELIGDVSNPDRRASVLSVENQFTSIWVAIFAPILGYIADRSMSLLFVIVGIMMGLIYFYNLRYYKKNKTA